MSKTVGHFVDNYLPLTQTFVYQYLINHDRYRPFVCSTYSENLEKFEFEPRETFMELSRLNPRFWIDGALKKFDIRDFGKTYYPRVISRRDPDILHAHFGPIGVSLAPCRKADRKLVTSFYGYDASRLVEGDEEMRDNYQRLFDGGDLFLVEGPAMRDKLLDIGCPRSKTSIQRIAIDMSRITPQYPTEDSSFRVLMVGRFVEKKGFPDGIKAFAEVFKGTDAELRIVGGEYEYGRERLEHVANSVDIQDQITFTGYLEYEAYLEEINQCSLLLAPSKRAESGDSEGGAPTVLIEAQASGKPVVATTHADIPYVVEDGETGFLASPGDVPELAKALQHCVRDPELMMQMGQAGVQRMAERHSIDNLAPALEEKYDELR
ncbi:glycosyltransferase [Halorubrum distributum]|uniref:Glycosyltransferase n=1 Tax=Halorubrum distributum TaxID=29283 RepID=A0A6B1IJF6_9EURY|nr:glycosyltransferase [Halorubrum terrestre]MYL66709.1 glycosyltransferase [Halorubrum terrestre]